MRIFVTGASGFIGSAVVAELLAAGHEVTGLARSPQTAHAVAAAGAAICHGDLNDFECLHAAAEASDGVIHLAYNHDFSVPRDVAAGADKAAIEAMGDALAGSGRPLVIASGLLGIAPGRLACESDAPPPNWPRSAAATALATLATRGVRTSSVRLAPTVHGQGDHGFIPMLIEVARRRQVAAYVGYGESRWPAVHRRDAARLFRLALESADPGTVLHAVAEEGVPTRRIAGVIARRLNVPLVSKTHEEAAAHFGFLGPLFGLDAPASSTLTRARFAWQPSGPELLQDLDNDYYFAAAS
jgi:nucleoside-diphosphate-sugar epimerase